MFIEISGSIQTRSERFFNDNSAPSVLGIGMVQLILLQKSRYPFIHQRRSCQIINNSVGQLFLLLHLMNFFPQLYVFGRLSGIESCIEESLQESPDGFLISLLSLQGFPDMHVGPSTVFFIRIKSTCSTENTESFGQKILHMQFIKRRQQLAGGQVSGSSEDDQHLVLNILHGFKHYMFPKPYYHLYRSSWYGRTLPSACRYVRKCGLQNNHAEPV